MTKMDAKYDHEAKILSGVEHLLTSEEDRELSEETAGNLKVGTWTDQHDRFHITIARVNPRTGFEKRVAIPVDVVPFIVCRIIQETAKFSRLVASLGK
jgi:hypothetical protein